MNRVNKPLTTQAQRTKVPLPCPSNEPRPMQPIQEFTRCVALAGGVGGSRMADGLYRALPPDALSVIVNTGDDFEHFGLNISPDIDTVMYTLAGIANQDTGWGIDGDTHHAMQQLWDYGEEQWFTVGDRDIATHIRRTTMTRAGQSLTDITQFLSQTLKINARILPMCDKPVSTFITTKQGERLAFQEYFVHRQHRNEVAKIEFANAKTAAVTAPARQALDEAEVIVFCPSNPFLSIAPILDIPTMRVRIQGSRAVRIAVSPLIGNSAVRGPAADIMRNLGHEPSALGVARLYKDLVQLIFIDEQDVALGPAIKDLGMDVIAAPIVMRTPQDRLALGQRVLQAARARLSVGTT